MLFLSVLTIGAIILVMLTGGEDDGDNMTVTAMTGGNGSGEGVQEPSEDPGAAGDTSGNTPDPVAVAAANTSIAIAGDRLRSAVPATHTIQFEGLGRVRVLLGESLLGVTPFEGVFPRATRPLSLRFERDGYRSVDRDVSLTEATVDVRLRRRREDRPDPPPVEVTPQPLEEPPEPDPPANPFGDTPIDDREESESSSPFGSAPVDDR